MNTSTTTSNMSASIQQAIVENNAGTRFVRQCQYDSAVKSFTSVLKILKPLAEIVEDNKSAAEGGNDNGNATNTKDSTDSDADADASTSTTPFVISFQNKSIDTTNNISDNDTTTTPSRTSSLSSSPSPDTVASTSTATSRKLKHFVFRNPIDIDDSSSYSPELLTKFLMIVMYNLALTLHLHALSLASSTSTSTKSNRNKNKQIRKLFLRSKKLYELVLEMHFEDSEDIYDDEDDNENDDENVGMDSLFTLALTNNLGLIYRTMNDKIRSKICFETMFSTMMMHLMYSHSHNNEDLSPTQSIVIKDGRIWNGLLSNAMDILFKHTYDVAAAAA